MENFCQIWSHCVQSNRPEEQLHFIWRPKDNANQCDQMIFKYLAVYNIGRLPKNITMLPKLIQKFAKLWINLKIYDKDSLNVGSGENLPNLVTLLPVFKPIGKDKNWVRQHYCWASFAISISQFHSFCFDLVTSPVWPNWAINECWWQQIFIQK